MGRYIRKFPRRALSLGPTEERGFALWVGYDIAGVDVDLSDHGFIKVDGWTDDQLANYNVATFKPTTLEELQIERKP